MKEGPRAGQLLLEDRSAEIPPFLRRTSRGGFMYPNIAIPASPLSKDIVTAPVTNDADALAERIAEGRRRDELVAKQLQKAEAEQHRERSKQSNAETARKRAIDKEKKNELKQSQRNHFLEHFRWEWDK